MDAGAVSGLNMAVLGISMVFLALLLLIVVITIMDKVLARLEGKKAGPGADAAAGASTLAAASVSVGKVKKKDELAVVALAAWGLHQRRRVSVRPAATTSRWAALARAKQLAGTGNRGR
jgi:sodium pump decarboxylase gamma subunit